MQTREWKTTDKSDWKAGYGPWSEEPDKKQWVDEETGLPCLIVRNPSGALCGYVGVSAGHPMFEKNYSERLPVPIREAVALGANPSYIALFCEALHEDDGMVRADVLFQVHGGLTFAGHCCPHPDDEGRGICHVAEPGDDDNVWWLGFDCAHYGDVSPKYDKEYLNEWFSTYKRIGYVTVEVQNLARQLKAMEPAIK